tara:strand:- start:869 stop:1921 length:1053 start_codon:yes stop_codon:yes gene_type:complete
MAQSSEFDLRYVAIAKESTYGTDPQATPSSAYFYGECDDESFAHKFDLLTRSDMSRAIAAKSVTGKEFSEGGVNMALQPDDFVNMCFLGFFPNNTYGSSAHTFDEGDTTTAHAYPSFTIRVGREDKEHKYTGMCANRMSLSASVNEYVMMSVDFVGKSESGTLAIDNSNACLGASDVAFHTVDALHFADGTVFLGQASDGTATAKVKAVNFEINLNRDTDNACGIGSPTYTRAPPVQMREVTGTIEFNQVIHSAASSTNEPTYDNLIAADGHSINQSTSTPAMVLNFKDEAGTNYVEVKFFHLRFEAPEASVSGRDTQTMTVNFVALADINNSNNCMSVKTKGAQRTSTY